MTTECNSPECNIMFTTRKSKKFCSPKCCNRAAHLRSKGMLSALELPTVSVIECNSPECTNEIKLNKFNHNRKKFCSRKCATKAWKLLNPEGHQKICREAAQRRYKRDPKYRVRMRVASSIHHSLANKGYGKDTTTAKILGCTYDEFQIHLEKQFTAGMSWENMEWQIDHNIPASWARSKKELKALSHHTNLQPMWKVDNQEKKNYFGGTKDAKITKEEYYLQNPLTM